MSEPCFLKDAAIWLGGYDFSGHCNNINLTGAKAELEHRVFGDGIMSMFPGLVSTMVELGGFWSAESALAPDPVIFTRIDPTQTPAVWPLIVVPPNAVGVAANTYGNNGYGVLGRQFLYSFGGAHGQLMPFSVKTLPSSNYALARQRIEIAKQSLTATHTSTGSQLGALTATQRLLATLHVFSITGTGSWTLTIQSDDNSGFLSPTTRITFTTVDDTQDPAMEIKQVAGAIADDWWRAVLTETSGTSTISVAVTIGINNLN